MPNDRQPFVVIEKKVKSSATNKPKKRVGFGSFKKKFCDSAANQRFFGKLNLIPNFWLHILLLWRQTLFLVWIGPNEIETLEKKLSVIRFELT